MTRLIVARLALLAIALPGCTHAPAEPAGIAFACPEHAPIRVVFTPDHASLFDGSAAPVSMVQRRSADGFRYAGAGQSLRGKGAMLDWTDAAGLEHRCTAQHWP